MSWYLILHKVNFILYNTVRSRWNEVASNNSVTWTAGRRPQQNILSEVSVPLPVAKRNVFAAGLASAWHIFVIALFSNILQNTQLHKPVASCEIRRWSFHRRHYVCTRRYRQKGFTFKWYLNWIMECAIVQECYVQIPILWSSPVLSFLIRIALFAKVWNHFANNCYACCQPGAFITTDEHLFTGKAIGPFTQSMATSQTKFGRK